MSYATGKKWLLIFGAVSCTLLSNSSVARVLTVTATGGFPLLSKAVAAAETGDTVLVQSGLYLEDSIVVDKRLTLQGEPGATLDADGGGTILLITADSVTVEGLTLQNTPLSFVDDVAALLFDGVRGCVARNNILQDNFFGIYLANSADCGVTDNQISAHAERETTSGNGIHLWYCRNVDINDNHISGHRDGIYLEFVEDARISGNVSDGNIRYGLHFMFSNGCRYTSNRFTHNGAGVAVMYTERVVMRANYFGYNWGGSSYGLLLKDITDSEIAGCVFHKNSIGLHAENATRVAVTECVFRDNGWAVKVMANSASNIFTHNNFLGNTFDVATNSSASYSQFTANYWSAYSGYDLDRDGTGDIPYHPVRLFSVLVEQQPPALLLLRSAFVDLLDVAESALPALTPKTLIDESPSMSPFALRETLEFGL